MSELPPLPSIANIKDALIAERFSIGRMVGAGSFGEVYVAIDLKTDTKVAIKFENKSAKTPQLKYEAKIYKDLGRSVGVPHLLWFGEYKDYYCLAMTLLGPSLEDLFNYCNRKFSLKTVLLLADQMISRLEYIHSKNYIHREYIFIISIKPDNFLMGLGRRENQVNITDFGLAKKYRDNTTNNHIAYKENKGLNGTVRYASINTQLGVEQSRRDDLESLGYIFIYFLRGQLPWQGMENKSETTTKDQLILQKKQSIPLEELCTGAPKEFLSYMEYCRGLGFDSMPDYAMLKGKFRNIFVRENIAYDYAFDWKFTKEDSLNSN